MNTKVAKWMLISFAFAEATGIPILCWPIERGVYCMVMNEFMSLLFCCDYQQNRAEWFGLYGRQMVAWLSGDKLFKRLLRLMLNREILIWAFLLLLMLLKFCRFSFGGWCTSDLVYLYTVYVSDSILGEWELIFVYSFSTWMCGLCP